MKRLTLVFIWVAVLGLLAPAVFAQDEADDTADMKKPSATRIYETIGRSPVATKQSSILFLGGTMYTGWAASLDHLFTEDDNVRETFPNQFFLNRLYLTLQGVFNEDVGFKVTLEGLGSEGAGGMAIKNAYLRFRNIRLFGTYSKFEIGVTTNIWEGFETSIWRYRNLRRISAGMYGAIDSVEVGMNFAVNFSDNQVSLQLGLWNGDFKKYTVFGFGSDVNGGYDTSGNVNYANAELNDFSKVAAAFIIYNQNAGKTNKPMYGGLVAAAGVMLQNKPGDESADQSTLADEDRYSDGMRLLGGVWYISRDEEGAHLMTLGVSGGYIMDWHNVIDSTDPSKDWVGNTYFGDFYFILNFGAFSRSMNKWELILRADYFYYGEHPDSTSDDNTHTTMAITFGVSYHPYPWLAITPAIKIDWQDVGPDNNLIGVWIDLNY